MSSDQLIWKSIAPGRNVPEHVHALIECPKGSVNKYELSKTSNLLILDRVLHSSVFYPHDYGLIPGTYADDGDPLDILVLMSHPVVPLTIVDAKPIGVLLMRDEKGMDEKILAVAVHDPVFSVYNELNDLPPHYQAAIHEFFRTYKALEEPKYAEVESWGGKSRAFEIIEKSIQNFKEKFGDTAIVNPRV